MHNGRETFIAINSWWRAKELHFDFCVSVVATANRHFNSIDSQSSR